MATKSKTAIVVGATGLIGAELVALLEQSADYATVITVTRRPLSRQSTKSLNHVIDFNHLDQSQHLFKGDVLFSCLGTTLAQAGSLEAQRRVDFTYQLKIAEIAQRQGVNHYLLVSSSGANAKSLSPYLKMKGELEEAVKRLPFERISVFQPSLLLGDRAGKRRAESIAATLMPTFCKLPGLTRYRPIQGKQVARKMLQESVNPVLGLRVFSLDHVFPD